MFQNQINELLKNSPSSDVANILNVLKIKFEETSDNSPLTPFDIPGDWNVLHVQKVLETIDTRLFATKNTDGTILISM